MPEQFATVNDRRFPVSTAISFVAEAMKNRAERLVIFSAAPDTSMNDVVNAMASMQNETSDLFFLSFTTSQQQRFNYPHVDLDCLVPMNPKAFLAN